MPSAVLGISSTAMTSLGSRNPGRHLQAKDITFSVSASAGVTAPTSALLPVVSIHAAVSSTPDALDNAAATRCVASSLVAMGLCPATPDDPRPALTSSDASKVTSSSHMPSRIS